MVDDSCHIPSIKNFTSNEKPIGMKPFILKDLTPEQQTKLNCRKIKQVRSDQEYLASHPELRGILVIILRLLMKTRPAHNIKEIIGRYFTKATIDIKEEVDAYIKDRETILDKNSFIMKPQLKQIQEIENNIIDYNVEGEDKLAVEESRSECASKIAKSINERFSPESVDDQDLQSSSAVQVSTEIVDEILENVYEEDNISVVSVDIMEDYEGPALTFVDED